jgi:hypothetical protein
MGSIKWRDDPKDCLREMLKVRLKSELQWRVVATALSSKAIDEKELAAKGKIESSIISPYQMSL